MGLQDLNKSLIISFNIQLVKKRKHSKQLKLWNFGCSSAYCQCQYHHSIQDQSPNNSNPKLYLAKICGVSSFPDFLKLKHQDIENKVITVKKSSPVLGDLKHSFQSFEL